MQELIEEPPWLKAQVDQHIARMKEMMGGIDVLPPGLAPDVLMTVLNEPGDEATKEEYARWEMACDRCGRSGHGPVLYSGYVRRAAFGTKVVVVFNVCAPCRAKP